MKDTHVVMESADITEYIKRKMLKAKISNILIRV